MTRTEHLLTKLAEEPAEVTQRVTKALSFGLTEIQPEPHANPEGLTNAERIRAEVWDLLGVYAMLEAEWALPPLGLTAATPNAAAAIHAKQLKVEGYLRFSAARGRVDGVPAVPDYPHPQSKPKEFTAEVQGSWKPPPESGYGEITTAVEGDNALARIEFGPTEGRTVSVPLANYIHNRAALADAADMLRKQVADDPRLKPPPVCTDLNGKGRNHHQWAADQRGCVNCGITMAKYQSKAKGE